MYKVRICFAKSGAAAYISHLDLMKTIQRSLRRALLPVRYSEGFNPHIYLSILAPLSTGYESQSDLCDFDLVEEVAYDEIVRRLNGALPTGLTVLSAGLPGRSAGQIAYAAFEIRYAGQHDLAAMARLFEQPVLLEKRSKRGSKTVDVTEYVHGKPVFLPGEGETLCRATLRLGDDPLNPAYLTAALENAGLIAPDSTPSYVRTALLDDKCENFH